MRIAGIMPGSLVNGSGIRMVIFLQGCPHYCEGCQNPDTWNKNGGFEIDIHELAEEIKKRSSFIDGITLSGGEPFLQQDECVELLKLLPEHLNVWVYTGYLYEKIRDTELAKMVDFIVDGRFIKEKQISGWYGGSSNQRLIDVKKGTVTAYVGENLYA